jgi:quercetin dioxygenase-like cupin family protein
VSPHLTALPAGEACHLEALIAPTPGGIASRVLAKTAGGSVALFAFDAGQGLTEHTSPFDALVVVLAGTLGVAIAGAPVEATPGTIVRLPAGVPHAVEARQPTRMLLVMLRDSGAA